MAVVAAPGGDDHPDVAFAVRRGQHYRAGLAGLPARGGQLEDGHLERRPAAAAEAQLEQGPVEEVQVLEFAIARHCHERIGGEPVSESGSCVGLP